MSTNVDISVRLADIEEKIELINRFITRIKSKNVFADVSKLRNEKLNMEVEYAKLSNLQFANVISG